MHWYWSDDVAQILLSQNKISPKVALSMTATPIGYRSDHESIEAATDQLVEDDEIPLAA